MLSISYINLQFRTKRIKNLKSIANIYKIIYVELIVIPTCVSFAILVGQKNKYIYIKIPHPVEYHLFF